MSKSKGIHKLAESGIKFESVGNFIEIFPSPIPKKIDDEKINTAGDLFASSRHLDFEILFMLDGEFVKGESGGKKYKFSREEYLQWQMEGFTSETIFQYINKTGGKDQIIALHCLTMTKRLRMMRVTTLRPG